MDKHMTSIQRQMLAEGLTSMGFAPTAFQLEQFRLFYNLLQEWNERMNLTALTDPEKIITHHFLDSASCAISPVFSEIREVLDLGTGAGFPGIPLRILFPGKGWTLMDSLNKRIRFLEQVVEELQLTPLRLVHARAEEAGRNPLYRERFEGVFSRAVASLPVLLEYTIPFLQTEGVFICQKGPQWKEELKEAERAMNVLAVSLEEVIATKIPFTDLQHQLLVFRKRAMTPRTYPRRAGTPSKKPL